MTKKLNLPFFSTVIICSVICLIAGCRNANEDSGAEVAKASTTEYTLYDCRTSTRVDNEKLDYSVGPFNNMSSAIDLTAAVPEQVRQRNRTLGLPTEATTIVRLVKGNTAKWIGQTSDASARPYTVFLKNKSDGQKSVEVVDHAISKTASAENGFCKTSCSGPTVLQGGKCIWTGQTPRDELAEFILIDLPTGQAAGPLVRVLNRAGTFVASKVASAVIAKYSVPKVMAASNADEGLKLLDKAVRGTNPLQGTPAVGDGNCANEALTQAIKLALGRWVCAIPYSITKLRGVDNDWAKISNDAMAVLGRKSGPAAHTYNINDVLFYLRDNLKEGEMALLGSSAIRPAGMNPTGHATLIAKVKGRLVHINNQNWEPKLQTLKEWDTSWKNFNPSGSTLSYHVEMIFQKTIAN